MAEKLHTQAAAKDIVTDTRGHQYLLYQMVLSMCMVATSCFRFVTLLRRSPGLTLSLIGCMHAVWLRFSGRPAGCLQATPLRY